MSALAKLFYEEIDAITEDDAIVLLPVSRLSLDRRFNIDEYWLFPPGDEFLVELKGWDMYAAADPIRRQAQEITEVTFEDVVGNVVFAYKKVLSPSNFAGYGHQADLDLILELSQDAEFVFDVLRYYEGRINVPEFLPGRAGSMNMSDYDACIVAYPLRKHYRLVTGQAFTHAIRKGIGYRFDEDEIEKFAYPEALIMVKYGSGEVGNIVKVGLSQFSRILEANTPTEKFILCMNLFEFLASPGEFQPFKKVKKEIIPHLCRDKGKYHELSERFWELTGKDDAGGRIIGYRTRVIHMGHRLEDFLNPEKIKLLLSELQSYLWAVIHALLPNVDWDWDRMIEYRKNLRIGLGVESAST